MGEHFPRGPPLPLSLIHILFNAVGGAPDIEKLRAAYREAHADGGTPPAPEEMDKPVSNWNTARARAIALAEAEMDLTELL